MSTPQKGAARLSHRWVFWRDKWEPSGAAGEMIQSLLDLGEVDTARNFWALFAANAVEALPEQCSLQVFKQHVKPEWEDASNINGGHFRLLPIPESGASPSRLWYALLACAIGDQFTLSTSICGVGFANKGSRKVISVWINTCDAAVVRTVQTELSNLSADKFTTKFITHKDLSHQGFTAQQSCWHRRTKSAPSPFVTTDFDEDEDTAPAVVVTDLKDRRRGMPVSLDSHFLHSGSEAGAPEYEHLRSKSEGLVRDIVPTVHPFGGHLPAPAPLARRQSPPPGGIERMDTEFNWSDPSNTDLRDSNSGVYPTAKAPTPMKEWADQWSPSLLNAALQNRVAVFSAGPGTIGQQSVSPGEAGATPNSTSNQTPSSGTQGSSQSRGLDASAAPFTSTLQQGIPPAEQSPMSLSQTLQGGHHHHPVMVPQVTLTAPHQHLHPGYTVQLNPPYPFGPPPPQFLHPHAFTSPTHFIPPPAHLSPSAYPTAQPLPYVIVRQPAYHAGAAPPATSSAPPASNNSFKGSRAPTNPNTVPTRDAPSARGGIGIARRESPPPQSKAQAPTPPPSSDPLNGSDSSRRTQHTKSDSAPFVFNGWKFPAGLNRKERRRIMFGDDVVPSEYPGAVFVGTDVPNGSCE